MNFLKKPGVFYFFLVLALLFSPLSGYAATIAGTITHLSGPLFAKKVDGSLKILSTKSIIEQGDTLVSEKDTYAQIKFVDNSEITLRPNSQLKIDSFSFDEAKPAEDSMVFSLIKGGLRSITGLLGKRNNARFALKTPTATIGIRGTIFIAEYVPDEDKALAASSVYRQTSLAAVSPALLGNGQTHTTISDAPVEPIVMRDVLSRQLALATPVPGAKVPGLYVQVLDGMIHLTNGGGTQNFTAGQFGFASSFQQLPIVLPSNPGIQFVPPVSFSSSTGENSANNSNAKSNNVDCEVR